jgi:hypothetical protein
LLNNSKNYYNMMFNFLKSFFKISNSTCLFQFAGFLILLYKLHSQMLFVNKVYIPLPGKMVYFRNLLKVMQECVSL